MRLRRLLCVASVLVSLASSRAAELGTAARPVLTIWPSGGPIAVDGKLEAAWRHTMRRNLVLCADGSGPKAPTHVYVARDAEALYVAWRCIEPQVDKLRVEGAKRDDRVWEGDCVELFVAPEARLPMLNAVSVPAGVEDARIRALLLSDYGIEIGAGLGPLAGKIWRVGLMGQTARMENVDLLVNALRSIL